MKRVQDMSPAEILRLAVLVGSGSFVLWIGGLSLVWKWFGLSHADDSIWSYFEGLSSAAVLGTVLGGGLIVLVQLVELVESRQRDIAMGNLQTYNVIFRLMMSEENIEARRWIYLELPSDPALGLAGLDSKDRARIKLVLNSLDYLGLLINQDCITADSIVEWASPFVVKVWHKLGPYVDYEAQRRNEPDYYLAARQLAERCQELRPNTPGESKPIWVESSL